MYPAVPWIVLTQNASVDVRNEVVDALRLHKPFAQFKESSFRDHLFYDIIYKNTILDLHTHLKNFVIASLEGDDDDGAKPCGVVYCKKRETVDLVAGKLREEGLDARSHHGGMRTKDRKTVLDDWSAGVFSVLVLTTSYSPGVDRPSIRFVVHWEVPQSIIGYYKVSASAIRQTFFFEIFISNTGVWNGRTWWQWVVVMSNLLL